MKSIILKIREIFSRKEKGHFELGYWRKAKQAEGALSNQHYLFFYTEHFNLPYDFYQGKRVLDIGCGPRGSLEWADNTLERVGLDPLADQYLSLGTTQHKMQYCSSGAESIPFPDNHFDIVTSFNSLDHVDDLNRTIKEIKRVTRKGGHFLLLSDLGHEPTPCEPTYFSWDIISQFQPEFEVIQQNHFEKKAGGIYQSLRENISYDHKNLKPRYGIISAKFIKN